jgi:hypothetical protein
MDTGRRVAAGFGTSSRSRRPPCTDNCHQPATAIIENYTNDLCAWIKQSALSARDRVRSDLAVRDGKSGLMACLIGEVPYFTGKAETPALIALPSWRRYHRFAGVLK